MLAALYDTLLQGQGHITHPQQAAYMLGIRPVARDVWRSYRNFAINVDYSNYDVQMSYMGRYFPFYTKVLSNEFSYLHRANIPLTIFTANPLNVSLFCSGPLPEAWSIGRVLRGLRISPAIVNISTFDFHVAGWTACRTAVLNTISAGYMPHTAINQIPHQYDMRLPLTPDQLTQITGSHIVVFQNCMNEIGTHGRTTLRMTINQIATVMAAGGFIAFFERWGYPEVHQFLNDLIFDLQGINFRLQTPGVRVDTLYDHDMRDRILRTPYNQLYFTSSNGHPPGTTDGLLMSAKVDYWSVIMQKPLII